MNYCVLSSAAGSCRGGGMLHTHVTVFVEFNLAAHELVAWVVADGDKRDLSQLSELHTPAMYAFMPWSSRSSGVGGKVPEVMPNAAKVPSW